MSDLNPKSKEIMLNGTKYGMRFTINAIDDIQEHFDIPISELSKIMNDERHSISNLRYILTVLINEDIDIRNDLGEQLQPVTERYVGRHINTDNMSEIIGAIYGCFNDGAPKVDNDDSEDLDPNLMTGLQKK